MKFWRKLIPYQGLAIEKFGGLNLVAPAAGLNRDGLMVAPDRETGKVTKKMSLANFRSVIDINP